MRLDLLAALNAERTARRACVLVTELSTGAERLVKAAEAARDPLASAIGAALAGRRSVLLAGAGEGGGDVFLSVQVPEPRLLLVGAVHISQALAAMAGMAGLDVTILDPRTAFATPDRFPDVPIIAEWPQDALPAYGLDPFTGVAALTHDPRIDDPALVAALKAGCFYVGALGSRRTHTQRISRLLAAGAGEAEVARIHAPIGMSIGAVSPPEIAVAVLAEVIADLHAGEGEGRGARSGAA